MPKIGNSFDALKNELAGIKGIADNQKKDIKDEKQENDERDGNTENNTIKNTKKEINKNIYINTEKENNKEINKNSKSEEYESELTENNTKKEINKSEIKSQEPPKEERVIETKALEVQPKGRLASEIATQVMAENLENSRYLTNRSYLLPSDTIREIGKLSYKFNTKKGDMIQKMLKIAIESLKEIDE